MWKATLTASATSLLACSAVALMTTAPAYAGTGLATYYSPGLGACGMTDTGADEVVALSAAQFNQSYCGKTIKITNALNGTSVTAKIVDQCAGCFADQIDMSAAVFKSTGDPLDLPEIASWTLP